MFLSRRRKTNGGLALPLSSPVRTVRRSKGRSANRSPTDEISASDERPSVQLLPLGVGREGAIACHGVI